MNRSLLKIHCVFMSLFAISTITSCGQGVQNTTDETPESSTALKITSSSWLYMGTGTFLTSGVTEGSVLESPAVPILMAIRKNKDQTVTFSWTPYAGASKTRSWVRIHLENNQGSWTATTGYIDEQITTERVVNGASKPDEWIIELKSASLTIDINSSDELFVLNTKSISGKRRFAKMTCRFKRVDYDRFKTEASGLGLSVFLGY